MTRQNRNNTLAFIFAFLLLLKSSVDATVTVDGRDAIVELTRTYLQCVTEVSAQKPAAAIHQNEYEQFKPDNFIQIK